MVGETAVVLCRRVKVQNKLFMCGMVPPSFLSVFTVCIGRTKRFGFNAVQLTGVYYKLGCKRYDQRCVISCCLETRKSKKQLHLQVFP